MYNFINIEGTGLGAYILAHLLQKYSDVGLSWQGFQKNDIFPIFIAPELYGKIQSIIPEIEEISDIYPMYYNGVSGICRRIGIQNVSGFTREHGTEKHTLTTSTYSQESCVFISHIPTLKFFSFPGLYSNGYYEYFDSISYPYYIFVWNNISYIACYRKDDIKDFLFRNHIIIQDTPDFEMKTGVSYEKDDIHLENKILFASGYGVLPFFLGLGNFIALIDSILVFLYISQHHEKYIKLLYSYRKKVAVDIYKRLQNNPYILVEENVEKFLKSFLDSLLRDF